MATGVLVDQFYIGWPIFSPKFRKFKKAEFDRFFWAFATNLDPTIYLNRNLRLQLHVMELFR